MLQLLSFCFIFLYVCQRLFVFLKIDIFIVSLSSILKTTNVSFLLLLSLINKWLPTNRHNYPLEYAHSCICFFLLAGFVPRRIFNVMFFMCIITANSHCAIMRLLVFQIFLHFFLNINGFFLNINIKFSFFFQTFMTFVNFSINGLRDNIKFELSLIFFQHNT